jgi:hypothetical protein
VAVLPAPARLLLELRPPEILLEAWPAEQRVGGRILRRTAGGYLALTNRRVAFLQAVGLGRRRTYHFLPSLSIPLEAITELREEPAGLVRVSDAEFETRDASTVVAQVEAARVHRLRELQGLSPSQGPPGMVTERIVVREVIRIPCRYCGAWTELGMAKCPACGAPQGR